jgi:hexosaminidase
VATSWGVFDEVFCAGKEETFDFLEGVLEEVIALFPSEYIHIGGDECPKKYWEKCRKCQARIRAEKLADEHELQSYFVRRVERFLNEHGRKLIGFDEILEGGISQTATVMSWRGTKGGIEAAKLGNHVVMTPNSHAYFDYYQSKDTENEPFAIGGYVPVEKAYSLDPTEGLNEQEARMIQGAQANLWTEYISDISHVQYMTLPRMAALAEVAWTPQAQRDYADFRQRAILLIERYKALGYNFAPHILAE